MKLSTETGLKAARFQTGFRRGGEEIKQEVSVQYILPPYWY
jgi:hypothetical protein